MGKEGNRCSVSKKAGGQVTNLSGRRTRRDATAAAATRDEVSKTSCRREVKSCRQGRRDGAGRKEALPLERPDTRAAAVCTGRSKGPAGRTTRGR